ncbi:hypothetical protein ACH9L7_11830 [Haloferax sp. S1W]|uniref:hypothetical protein n=1 Tax=Haloferax sp. S1W TaxID=3377110 RepID=UPI0037C8D3DE
MDLSRLIWYTMPLAVVAAAIASSTLAERYVVKRLRSNLAVKLTRFLAVSGAVIGTLLFYMVVVGYFTNQ